jgi:hypothetical protein
MVPAELQKKILAASTFSRRLSGERDEPGPARSFKARAFLALPRIGLAPASNPARKAARLDCMSAKRRGGRVVEGAPLLRA